MTSTARRWISGSLANWVRTGIGALFQIVSVPVFLSHWTAGEFGVWLVIWSLPAYFTSFDLGHQNYLAYEFIRAPDRPSLWRLLSAAIPAALAVGLVSFVGTCAFIFAGGLRLFLGTMPTNLLRQAETVLLVQAAVWLLTGALVGVLVRAIVPLGHFPRGAWWGAWYAAVTGTVPLVAVWLGADLLQAGLSLGVATLAMYVPMIADCIRLCRREGFQLSPPRRDIALENVARSFAVTFRDFLGQFRQQGVRLILSPLAGVEQMTAFATTRTGANVALQALNSVALPFEPELLGFIRRRDQSRTEVAFGALWALPVYAIGPAIVAVQFVAPAIFTAWTRGRIVFDPLTFSALSAAVLVYAQAQPAMMVVRGNNLLKEQLTISFVAVAMIAGGLLLSVPRMGVGGAAFVLLAVEGVALVLYQRVAARWMCENSLAWPAGTSRAAAAATIAAVTAATVGALLPVLALVIAAGYCAVAVTIGVIFYKSLPAVAKEQISELLGAADRASG